MDIFGSMFSRLSPVDANAELARKQEETFRKPTFVGFDTGRDDWCSEATFEMQANGKLKILSLSTFKKTNDL